MLAAKRLRRWLALPAALLVVAGCASAPPLRPAPARGVSLLDGDVERWFSPHGLFSFRREPRGPLILEGGPGYLATRFSLRDFTLVVEAQAHGSGNSGIFLRARHPALGLYPDGVEVQIDHDDPRNPTGSLYDRVRARGPIPTGEAWFSLCIEARGAQVTVWLDGHLTVEGDGLAEEGFLALQAHDPWSKVVFRRLELLDARVRCQDVGSSTPEASRAADAIGNAASPREGGSSHPRGGIAGALASWHGF